MIKVMRDASHNYPWLLKSIMGILAIAFVITMGWWGFGEQPGNTVATVGDLVVTRDEFRRAYENMYRFYKEKVPGEFKDETIKQFVIEQLVDNRLWQMAAKEMGITVSDGDLREMIDFGRPGADDQTAGLRYRQSDRSQRPRPAGYAVPETATRPGRLSRIPERKDPRQNPSGVALSPRGRPPSQSDRALAVQRISIASP